MSTHDDNYDSLGYDVAATSLLDKIYTTSMNVASDIDVEVKYKS